jgi:hypothetical protein
MREMPIDDIMAHHGYIQYAAFLAGHCCKNILRVSVICSFRLNQIQTGERHIVAVGDNF